MRPGDGHERSVGEGDDVEEELADVGVEVVFELRRVIRSPGK